MLSPALQIVIGCLIGLALLEAGLKRHDLHRRQRQRDASSTDTPNASAAPRLLLPGLSVTGIDERGAAQLRDLIQTGNLASIAAFLAFYRPVIAELNFYVNQIYKLVSSSNAVKHGELSPDRLGKILKSINLPSSEAGFTPDALTEAQMTDLLRFGQSARPVINRQLMARFGGLEFYPHFSVYCRYPTSTVLVVPASDPDRWTFEVLVESGIATRGRDIDHIERLGFLTLQQLRSMAKDLNLTATFRNKTQAIETLSKLPGSRVLFLMLQTVDDLFTLRPITENREAIHQHWRELLAVATLLTSAARPGR